MTTTMNCERFDEQLPEYMEGDLGGDEREALERHAESCARCRPILEDLKSIVAAAGALGPIEPPRDLWSGIESRIGTRVVPLGTRRGFPAARSLAAAVVLMAATAGVTWKLATRSQAGVEAPTKQPSTLAAASTDEPSPRGGTGPIIVTTPPQVAMATGSGPETNPTPAASKSPALAASGSESTVHPVANGGHVVSTAALYDHEITRLHSVIEQRRGELDPKTIAAIERSLAVIDTAIAQARSALAADPASRFLHGRLTDALDKKVELLRTTAMLPARS